jgi:hypothetical protein
MDESTFFQKLLHAEVMSDIERPEYWRGYIRGLQRAFYGEAFATQGEHQTWLSLAHSDDRQDRERGSGYRRGLQVG